MENAIKKANDMAWQIELECAIANGQNRLKAREAEAKNKHEAEQFDRKQKWAIVSQQIRRALPEILQPLMKDMFDPNGDPYNFPYEEIIIDGEAFGLAPIEVNMRLGPSNEEYQIHQYRIFGIALIFRSDPEEYFFAAGDENYILQPQNETEIELALARAAEVYRAKCDIEFQAKSQRSGEFEYLDTGEDAPPVQLADQALTASIRAIVRDEMFNPPTT